MGVAMDERILDQLLCTSRTQQNGDAALPFFRQLGALLIEHPFAIDALMDTLFLSGGRAKSANLKMKCAKLVAIAVIASDRKVIESLGDEDKSEEWAQKLYNKTTQDIELIKNVSD